MATEPVDQVARGFGHRHDVIDPHAFGIAYEIGCLNPGCGGHFFAVAENQIDLAHGRKPMRFGLRRATGDDHPRGRVRAPEVADFLLAFAHSLGGDGAGVHDHRVAEPGGTGHLAHRLGLVGVEPAAEG